MMTPERIAEIRSKPHGPDVADLMDTVESLRIDLEALQREARITKLENARTSDQAEVFASIIETMSAKAGELQNRIAQLEGEKRDAGSLCAVCGSTFDNRLHRGCPRCAIAAGQSLLRWVCHKVDEIYAETAPMGSDFGHGGVAQIAKEIIAGIREWKPVESADQLAAVLRAQREWSTAVAGAEFPVEQIVKHLRRELVEIEAEPHRLEEWIDGMLLLMDGYWRNGGQPEHLMRDLMAKQSVNRARKWARTAEGTMEHVREGE